MQKSNAVSTSAGLAVAWGGPALLVSPLDRLLGSPERLATKIAEQLILWAFFAMILAIVVLWEKLPLESIGVRRFRWQSIAWGLLLAAFLWLIAMPVLTAAVRAAGISTFEAGLAKTLALPPGFRIFAVLTAGIVEDTLFLGYAFTRLVFAIGNRWIAGLLAVSVFALLHFPYWGAGPVLIYVFTAGITTAFFAWRMDLLANVVAHVIVDGLALVIVPALSATPPPG